jgi:hypothetical protein
MRQVPRKEEVNHMAAIQTGYKIAKLVPVQTVELFGHVILVEGYNLPSFLGCHALIALRDTPGKTIAVLTSESRLQSLLETGLMTGNLVDVYGQKLSAPPTPRGGNWDPGIDVYNIDGVTLYNFK